MKLNYKEFGTGDNVLVILHGLLGSLDNWQTLAKYWADQGLHVYTVDQRNHGKSPHSPRFDYEAMAGDLAQFLNDHSLKNVALLGHSMGGKTVMRFLKDYEELVRKVIVADISPRQYGPHHQHIFNGLKAIDLNSLTNRGQADEILSHHVSNPGERQFLLKNLSRTSVGFAWKINLEAIEKAILNVGEAQLDLSVSVESLFIHGSKSDYILQDDEILIKNMFSNVRFEEIIGAGHWLHADQPKLFAEHVLNFVNGN